MEDLRRLKEAVKGKRILLLGPPGSGKGNRSRDLEALGLVHIGLGIILRARTRKDPDSELSQKISRMMKRGSLIPDEIVVPIVMDRLNQPDCQECGFVLDGFPRTKVQADLLFSKFDLDLALHLNVPKAHLINGIIRFNRRSCIKCAAGYSDFDPPREEGICDRCGNQVVRRPGDNLEVVKTRLKIYEQEIEAFLPDLEAKGIVEALPITVSDNEEIEDKYLKKLGDKIYLVRTDEGGKARMLNLKGMQRRLYDLLAKRFSDCSLK